MKIAVSDAKSHLRVGENMEDNGCWIGTHGLLATAMMLI